LVHYCYITNWQPTSTFTFVTRVVPVYAQTYDLVINNGRVMARMQ
jgi:hypothetical protein